MDLSKMTKEEYFAYVKEFAKNNPQKENPLTKTFRGIPSDVKIYGVLGLALILGYKGIKKGNVLYIGGSAVLLYGYRMIKDWA